ncbi:MAG: FAD-dependent oxidoreductase, partial [Candidatus Hydrogenedentes bacterium]|nr:FAD-dependent oxidoreductase [Candidatus Hydrogenedentota bacterium]
GIVMDNSGVEKEGPWHLSRSVSPMVGVDYLHDSADKTVVAVARYRIPLPQGGRYEVRISYSAHPNRAANALVTVNHVDGIKNILVNQRNAPPNKSAFLSLGEFNFAEDALIVISNKNADGHVIADAVQLLQK